MLVLFVHYGWNGRRFLGFLGRLSLLVFSCYEFASFNNQFPTKFGSCVLGGILQPPLEEGDLMERVALLQVAGQNFISLVF